MEGKENSKMFTLQILGKEKDSRISLGKRILDSLTQIESIRTVSMQNTESRLNLLDSRPRKKAIRLLKWRSEMKCQRCLREGAEAIHRVFTEMIDIKVCAWCADEARKLGINVEPLDSGEGIRFQPVRASDI